VIITALFGGLGNQMFQYAAGRALALRHGVPLGLDCRRLYSTNPPRRYALHHFDIKAQKPEDAELPPVRKTGKLAWLAWRAGLINPPLLGQQADGYDARIERAGPATYLYGYWQSERFFAGKRDQIRRDFAFVTPASQSNLRLADEIMATPAVSLHVRRGDYVANKKTNAIHGLCSKGYYHRALTQIATAAGICPLVFVFSDDPQWVRDNLDLPFPKRVVAENDSDHQYEDLRLMTLCRHHVIANSSFSWWGAYLNPSVSKQVVAPRQWFAAPDKDNPDICPPGWLQLA